MCWNWRRALLVGSMFVVLLAMVALVLGVTSRHPYVIVGDSLAFESEVVRVSRTGYTDRLAIRYVRDEQIYAVEDHFFYVSRDLGASYERIARLPKIEASFLAKLKDRVARLPIVRSVRRNVGPFSVVVLESGTIIVFYDRIYRSVGAGTFEAVFAFEDGHNGPFPSSQSVAVGKGDTLYFGEYDTSSRPRSVNVYRGSNDGRSWEVAHTFASGEIFHIHGVYYDPFRNRYWIATGDNDDESYLLYTTDHFESLDTLGGGNQDWRLVSLIIQEHELYWGSDNDRTGSSIFRWGFEDGRKEEIQWIGKPSYYASVLADGSMVVTTTYEPESPFSREWQPRASASVWLSRDGATWSEVLEFDYRDEVGPSGALRTQVLLPGGDYTSLFLHATPLYSSESFAVHRFRIEWSDSLPSPN